MEEVEKQHQKEKKEMAACFQQQIELSLADTYTQVDQFMHLYFFYFLFYNFYYVVIRVCTFVE